MAVKNNFQLLKIKTISARSLGLKARLRRTVEAASRGLEGLQVQLLEGDHGDVDLDQV